MVAGTRQRARRKPAEVRREDILRAAIHVFAQTSYHTAGTAEIAREAGVAEPTIYRHFGSKRELYLAALARCGEVIRQTFAEIAGRVPDAVEALHEMGHWYCDSVVSDPDELRLRYRATGEAEDDEARALLRAGYEQILETVANVIRRGQQQGVITREVAPEPAALLFISLGKMIDLGKLLGAGQQMMDWIDLMGDVHGRALAPRPDDGPAPVTYGGPPRVTGAAP